jgi:multicomponent Na+:H+ antiporter subunit D
MLAFVTISFVGVFLVGAGLLTEEGVAGTSVFVLADGFGKALLFACVGILQTRFGKVGQRRLFGRARALRGTAFLFIAGGFLTASLPPFGPFLGKSMIDDAALKAGYAFVPALVMLSSALCGAAVLKSGARVFLGWGTPPSEERDEADEETTSEAEDLHDRTPAVMMVPTVLLFVGAIGIGVWFGFADLAASASRTFVDVGAYGTAVFGKLGHLPGGSSSSPAWFDYLYCTGATLLAVALAAFGLWGREAGRRSQRILLAAKAAMTPLRRLHTGRVGDYTAALALGVGLFAALMTLTLR